MNYRKKSSWLKSISGKNFFTLSQIAIVISICSFLLSYRQTVLNEQRQCYEKVKPQYDILYTDIQDLVSYTKAHSDFTYKKIDDLYLKKISKTRQSALELYELLEKTSYLYQPVDKAVAILNIAEANATIPPLPNESTEFNIWAELITLRKQLSLSRQKNPDCVKLI